MSLFLIRRLRLGVASVSLAVAAQGSAQVPATAKAPAQTPPLQPLTVTQLDDRTDASELDGPRRVSVTLAEPTPVTDLLLMLVRDTRLSVVAEPDVQGTFRGELRDVTLRQAFETILRPNGLEFSVEGSVIRVFQRRVETRRFDLNYVLTRRRAAATVANPSPLTLGGSSFEVTRADDGHIFDDLAAGVQTLLSGQGRFNLDRKAALLQVTDYPERLVQIDQYLDAVRQRAARQVQIQARVIELVLREGFEAGIDWPLLMERAGDAVVPTSLATAFRIRDFDGFLGSLAVQGDVNVIASPMVNALNNEPVIMRVGTEESQASEGMVLMVTPQIAGDGVISMSITPRLTERVGEVTRAGERIPVMSVREADTLVQVQDSETVVIAGLTQERELRATRKVPVLGDIPGVGGLFRSTETSTRKTDLVILLTPTVASR